MVDFCDNLYRGKVAVKMALGLMKTISKVSQLSKEDKEIAVQEHDEYVSTDDY
jgi:hypothetical protein